MTDFLDFLTGPPLGCGDAVAWYEFNNGMCPNCGLNLKEQGPERNLFPHMMGACRGTQEELFSEES